jgi:hypothetical protein
MGAEVGESMLAGERPASGFSAQVMTSRVDDVDSGLIFFKSRSMQGLDASAAPIDWHPVTVTVRKRHGRAAAWRRRETAAIEATLQPLQERVSRISPRLKHVAQRVLAAARCRLSVKKPGG